MPRVDAAVGIAVRKQSVPRDNGGALHDVHGARVRGKTGGSVNPGRCRAKKGLSAQEVVMCNDPVNPGEAL